MPINVFGNSSNISENIIDTTQFVQKPYLRTNYIETNIEEDIDLKNQFRIKNLPDLVNKLEAASQNFVEILFKDPSILKDTAHINLTDRNITKPRFIQVIQMPQIDLHLTAELYIDNSIDEFSLLRNQNDKVFNNFDLTKINSFTLNTQAFNDNRVNTKVYIDHFHQENERSRRDLGIDFYDESSNLVKKNNQDKNFIDKNITNINSITTNRKPTSDNELAKKNIDDELE